MQRADALNMAKFAFSFTREIKAVSGRKNTAKLVRWTENVFRRR